MQVTIKHQTNSDTAKTWTYQFESLTSFNHGFFSYMVGCERGTLYAWVEFGWTGFGTDYFFSETRTFKRRKVAKGTYWKKYF